MPAKAWFRERWDELIPALEALTVDDQEKIKRLCDEEIAYWRTRMEKPSALKDPMRFTRNRIKEIQPLTERNSFVDPRDQVRKHIGLKYMNFTKDEWAEVNRPSAALAAARLEDQQTIEDPDAVIAKAEELLRSPYWADRLAALAVVIGRRLEEILHPKSKLYPKTLYSVTFDGQLKRKDKTLLPYEIPTNAPAALVLDAWTWVRGQVDCTGLDEATLSTRYGPDVKAAAQKHFAGLVPPRSGGDLYTHLFRSVYGCIAVFYYCPDRVKDLIYLSHVLGHYWLDGNGDLQRDTAVTMHYADYQISAAAVMRASGRSKGTHLDLAGVEVLDVFKEKPAILQGKKKGQLQVSGLQTKAPSQTGASLIKPKESTKAVFDQIGAELGSRVGDDTLVRLCEDFYRLEQVATLLAPFYGQFEIDPAQAGLNAPLQAVEILVQLLKDVAPDAEKKEETPIVYLRELAEAKREFKKSYEKRHQGKDYSKMSLDALRRTRTPGAATERFKRAVDAILAYNDQATIPEMRWFVNAAAVKDLVGGRPGDAKEYIQQRLEVDIKAHHEKYSLRPGVNSKSVPIQERVLLPKWPAGVEPTEENDSDEEGAEGEEATTAEE
jgi:Telomere resolvase